MDKIAEFGIGVKEVVTYEVNEDFLLAFKKAMVGESAFLPWPFWI